MHRNLLRLAVAVGAGGLTASALTGTSAAVSRASTASPATLTSSATGQYIVLAKGSGDVAALRGVAARAGGRVGPDVRAVTGFVVSGSTRVRDALARDGRVADLVEDGIRSRTEQEPAARMRTAPGLASARQVTVTRPATAARGADPAYGYKGLLWTYDRIGLPGGHSPVSGQSAVTVGVADTGLDFTHAELAGKVQKVVDFSDPRICPLVDPENGVTDKQLAQKYGGPEKTDWNGHGTWIGGNIAARLDGKGMNGIAPGVGLVALKIAQNCGYAFDSSILNSFVYAADHGIDVVSISFGGYLNRSKAGQNKTWKLYERVVKYARHKGTIIAASAGNEHARVDALGKIVTHGTLTTPGTAPEDFVDRFGLSEVPGGIPGVVNVASTGKVVVRPSRFCAPGSTGTDVDVNATCKPRSDRHQAAGTGTMDQLAYYSNYGPGIDIAAPGGARKFNLPNYDRGGTPGFPYTGSDLTKVFEDFSITSNWSTEIPCFTFSKPSGFPPNNCYTAIQGTSMAAPHVSAALALEAAAHPGLRGNPAGLEQRLYASARTPGANHTRALSATDKSPGDLYGDACVTGYCHLEGPRISSSEAYGAGIVNVARP